MERISHPPIASPCPDCLLCIAKHLSSRERLFGAQPCQVSPFNVGVDSGITMTEEFFSLPETAELPSYNPITGCGLASFPGLSNDSRF